jgi:hypothetical protein
VALLAAKHTSIALAVALGCSRVVHVPHSAPVRSASFSRFLQPAGFFPSFLIKMHEKGAISAFSY